MPAGDQLQRRRSSHRGVPSSTGGRSTSSTSPHGRRRRRTQNNRAPVASGICVERRMTHFTHVPRIPLGGRPPYPSSSSTPGSSKPSGGNGSSSGGDADWPPPLPPAPVCFSPSGRYLFSGGHESGALLMWQFDYNSTGQVSLALFCSVRLFMGFTPRWLGWALLWRTLRY